MRKFYSPDEYVYKELKVRMSTQRMANVLYAGFETNARFTTMWNMNRGEYTRQQNAYNGAIIMVHIHPELIETFNDISGLELTEPQRAGI